MTTPQAPRTHSRRTPGQRSLQIAADEESADRPRDDDELDPGLSPDAAIAEVTRSGRQHDHDDTAAYSRTRPRPRRYGPGA